MTPQDLVDAVVDAILAGNGSRLDQLLRTHNAMPEMRELAEAVYEIRLLLRHPMPPAGRARHKTWINDVLARRDDSGGLRPPAYGP